MSNDIERYENAQEQMKALGAAADKYSRATEFARYHASLAESSFERYGRIVYVFQTFLEEHGIKDATKRDYQEDPSLWKGVTAGLINAFVEWMKREGYAIATINKQLIVIKTYCKLAFQAGVIEDVEYLRIKAIPSIGKRAGVRIDETREKTRIGKRKEKEIVLTPEQIALLKQPLENKWGKITPGAIRNALIIALVVDHGFRASEVSELKRKDIQENTIHFHRPKIVGTRHEYGSHVLSPDVRKLLDIYLPLLPENCEWLIMSTRRGKFGRVLHCRQMGREEISRVVRETAQKILGIENVGSHSGRHTRATIMVKQGVDLLKILEFFGWTNTQTAMRYIHTSEEAHDYWEGE